MQDGVRNFTEGFTGKRRLTGEHFEEGSESVVDAKNDLRSFVGGKSAAADAESEGFAFDELHDENEMFPSSATS